MKGGDEMTNSKENKRTKREETTNKLKYDEAEMIQLSRKDRMIDLMMKSASAKSVFNSEVLGDSIMERKYQEIQNQKKKTK